MQPCRKLVQDWRVRDRCDFVLAFLHHSSCSPSTHARISKYIMSCWQKRTTNDCGYLINTWTERAQGNRKRGRLNQHKGPGRSRLGDEQRIRVQCRQIKTIKPLCDSTICLYHSTVVLSFIQYRTFFLSE